MSYVGQKIDFEEEYSASCERLYQHISNEGSETLRNGALKKYRSEGLLEKLIEHFESTEEYEKCGVLSVINKELNSSTNEKVN